MILKLTLQTLKGDAKTQFWTACKTAAAFERLGMFHYGNTVAAAFHGDPLPSLVATLPAELHLQSLSQSQLAQLALHLVPCALSDSSFISIRKESNPESGYVWQFPCNTEERALLAHQSLFGADLNKQIFHVYIGVPWATFIDLKMAPNQMQAVLAGLSSKIKSLRKACRVAGFELRAHSVCQHIRWRETLPVLSWLGVNRLHASHARLADEALAGDVIIRGWPLVAVNVETPERRRGLVHIPWGERSTLCSFKGAHMRHYLDSSRLQLAELSWPEDCSVEVSNTWHFNSVVYGNQIRGERALAHNLGDAAGAESYNQQLSNSKFGLCPVGAGPNTLRLWECMAMGTIPVIFSRDLAVFKKDQCFADMLVCCVVWDRAISQDLVSYLQSYPETKANAMSERLRSLYAKTRTPTVLQRLDRERLDRERLDRQRHDV